MKYLIIAIINAIYGILLFATLTRETPGLIFIVFIASVLTIIGLVGFSLWLWGTISDYQRPQTTLALKNWLQVTKGVDILLILGLLFRAFILQPFLVDGNSMKPTYQNKEFILVDRISYKFHLPKRGEVIIFHYPKAQTEDYIKRIIGLPGETVLIENGQVYINDQLLNEGYLREETKTIISNDSSNRLLKKLSSEEYFVMGDNRSNSSDSRDWGPVSKNYIVGRAWYVVYPFDYFGKVKNPTVILGTPIPLFSPTSASPH